MQKGIRVLSLMVFIINLNVDAQQNYNNHEGSTYHKFGERNGILDSSAVNPQPNPVNLSSTCVKYRRSKEEIYDNIKLTLDSRLKNVTEYATYEGNPGIIKMKIYSTAPKGTTVELQFGKKSEIAYPDGVHSQYQATTTKQNEWEELSFKFAQIPEGSKVNDGEVDQVTILFAPNSKTNDIFFYDDLTGPQLSKVE